MLETLKLDPSRLMICLSHTHAGPALQSKNASRPGGHLIKPYKAQLRAALAEVIHRAFDVRQLATLTWRYGRCDLATNRDLPEPGGERVVVVGYNPLNPADATLLVGRVCGAAGIALATVVNYACHPTTLAWDNRLLSPDYVGAMRELVQSHTRGAGASRCLDQGPAPCRTVASAISLARTMTLTSPRRSRRLTRCTARSPRLTP